MGTVLKGELMSKAASRIFSREFKLSAVHRMLSGENVSALGCELRVLRKELYKWRDNFRARGPDGLRSRGRPRKAEAAGLARTPAPEQDDVARARPRGADTIVARRECRRSGRSGRNRQP